MSSEPARSGASRAPRSGTVVPLRPDDGAGSACPLAKCDGTGWIDAEGGAVEPCECRSLTRHRSRARGLASTIPARYRGVSFDRPPLSDMARQPETRHVVDAVRDSFAGSFGTSSVLWGTLWAVALAVLGTWWGTATFRKENA